MSEAGNVSPPRIAVALSGQAISAMLAGLLRQLASSPAAQLRVVFIEDSDLLKAVALPFTVELCSVTNVVRPISREHLEAQLRREALTAERDFARVAEAAGLPWRFEVVRARHFTALNSTLASMDMLVLPPRESGAGQQTDTETMPVVAIVDTSPAGTRALACARAIARTEGAPLRVYCVGESAQLIAADGAGFSVVTATDVPRLLRLGGQRLTILAATLLEELNFSQDDPRDLCPAPLIVMR